MAILWIQDSDTDKCRAISRGSTNFSLITSASLVNEVAKANKIELYHSVGQLDTPWYDVSMTDGQLTLAMHPSGGTAAAAWVSSDAIAVAFYQVLTDEKDIDFVYLLHRELRIQVRSGDYPEVMSQEELDDRLRRWHQNDFTNSGDHQEPANFPSSELRTIPLSYMHHQASTAYCPPSAPQQLDLPAEKDVEVLATTGTLLGFRNSRDLMSRYYQLKVACLYAKCIADGDDRPVVTVAGEFTGSTESQSVTRTRNILQRSRESGFLTTAQHGRTGGQVTHRASDFCDLLNRAIAGETT